MSSQRPESAVPTTTTPTSSEVGRAARGGALTLVGTACSAAFGFAFSLLLARLWGATDAGVVLQAIALFTIALSFARLGMDTTAVWLLPRLRSSAPEQLPAAIAFLLLCAATAGTLLAASWWGVRGLWPDGTAVVDVVDAISWALPVAAVAAVGLGCTRAFGGIVAFNAIDNLATPILRPVLLVLAHLAGVGVVGAALGWAVPTVVAAVAVTLVLQRATTRLRHALGPGVEPARWPGRDLRTQIARYSLPRTFASAMEQSIIWVDVLLVGVIAGSAAAGVYGSAARFVAAGVIVATAVRIVVAPRFSALLGEGRTDEVASLYAVTARWILLFGAPVYLTLAVFAPTVLAWLGPDFASGASAMVILCLGSVVVLAAGNVQALLLMSGRSGLGAINKAIVLLVNVVGNLLLVPVWGIEAAAVVWTVSMVLDTVLASVQVGRATGIVLAWGSVVRVGLAVAFCVAGPSLAIVNWWGQGTAPLLTGVAVGGVLLLGYAVLDRRLLHFDQLATLTRR